MENNFVDANSVRKKIKNVAIDIIPSNKPIYYDPHRQHMIKKVWENKKWRLSNKASVTASIVETRPQESNRLELTISALARKLKIPIHIFCGTENINEALQIGSMIKDSACKIFQIGSNINSPEEYNQLLMSYEFWQNLQQCKKVFVFQADSSICQKSNFELNDFFEFDYIGAQWGSKRPSGFFTLGGCGGFSLRDYRMSLQALKMFGNCGWQYGEDGFFAFFIEVLYGRVATLEDMSKFCSQLWWDEGCFGIHRLDLASLTETELKSVKHHCPNWIQMNSKD